MTEAVIVSTARTPLAKSWKGAFNMTHGATLGGHAVKAAVERAGIDVGRGRRRASWAAPTPEGATGGNIARQIALRAGLPVTDQRHDRQPLLLAAACRRSRWRRSASSPARATSSSPAASRASRCVQNEMNKHMLADPWLVEHKPEIYWTMLQTAEQVAKRYKHRPRAQDEYGAASQQKACRGAGGRQVQGRDRADHRDGRRRRRGDGPAHARK